MAGIIDQVRRLLRPGADFRARASDIDPSTLLPRPPRKIDLRAARKLLAGKSVLVTGAGGTIGSELCRQIIRFEPAHLALVDNAEFALYQVDLELKEAGHGAIISSDLTDVCRIEHLNRVFERTRPDVVLHAAAYKHVPIVEENRCAGALTNVFGAKNVFDTAIEHGAESVVFISTDKAVNPTSFMGATKRIAELYAQALDVAQNDTRFVTVRFGNVLGSTGSVAPLFKRQIEMGGPVTVTHPEIIRYFMTTPEAVQLVLLAASLDNADVPIVTHDGRVFVLDMGEPVKILDFAKRMIEAYGLAPGKDIEIKFTGLRPGEKLFEEIFLDTDALVKTGAEGVLLASPAMIDLPLLTPRLSDVVEAALEGEQSELDEAVHHLVPEFSANGEKASPARNKTNR
ncbi:polysaccharide biosynthesis protein [Hyphococcus flavus]|uniref:Polysaccharide biosynthesis protein n=1 Tax=Hyphococcus flavus TaxID=1866326 RepID=A0AAE9ZCJ9_9PROT|nr:polysaccharide biosynthesis protein [Hyphococcus flavus]WDI30472.1 polysaccharide biosynthesis protein [Hyphococcus flavus]